MRQDAALRAPATDRLEFKYRLDPVQHYRVRIALSAMVRLDPYSLAARHHRYSVRSLYYDANDYPAYVDKTTGVANRIKLRFRCYGSQPSVAGVVKLEIKTRAGRRVGKHSSIVTLSAHRQFLATRSWGRREGPVAEEFRRLVLLRALSPLLLVDYEREALLPRDGSDVRITFDTDLRFANARELFPMPVFFHRPRPRFTVLEIKVRSEMPGWLSDLIRRYELQSEPNSKYALGIEHTQPAIFR